jgi:hypothetical protein
MVSGKIKTYFLGAVSLLVIANSLFPMAIAHATNTVDEDIERRKLIGFRTCLEDRLDTDDEVDNFNDMWKGDDASYYHKEDLVVGFELDSTNGVWTCKTAIANGLKVLFPSVDTEPEAVTKLIEVLTGKSNFDGGATSGNDLKINRNTLVGQINDKLTGLGEPRRAFTANRLAPLITVCYDIKEYSQDMNETDHNFKMDIGGKSYFMELKDLDDDSFEWIDQNGGSALTDYGNNTSIGDIELGFDARESADIGSNWDSWESDFYPLGSDLNDYNNFTGDRRGDNGIVDCKFIKEKRDFFTAGVVYAVDPENDTLTICRDTNGNNACEESEVLAPLSNPAAAGLSATGDSRPSCELTGTNPLSWMLCPMINGAAAVADWILDTVIVPFLDNVPISADPSKPIFKVWSSFRVIANILLVGMLLVIAIAQGGSKS